MTLPAVIVIHLKRHASRRRHLAKELAAAGFQEVHWLDAVDGTKLASEPPWEIRKLPPVTPWQDWTDPYSRRAMTLGEVGCTLSHVLAWRRIVASGYPAIIIEDDATVVQPLQEDIPEILKDLEYLNFDLCYLAQRNSPGPKPLMGRHVHLVNYHPIWTLAYLLSPAGAERLLSAPWQQHLIPADEHLPACFGCNNDAEVNRVYTTAATAGSGMILSTNQRYFTPKVGSAHSETEKSQPVQSATLALLAFTVASEEKPELQRLLASAKRYGLPLTPLGLGVPWRGGDMAGPGGGQKVNLLRPALAELPAEQPVLFVDGYDVIISGHMKDILLGWEALCEQQQPLFAAEVYCWPDAERSKDYPETETPYRFLNSGAFIGRAGDLSQILAREIPDHADDQRYYTECFLAAEHNIVLDTQCRVFQCLNGALGDVQADEGRGLLYNQRTEQWPKVIHANGPSKEWLEEGGKAVGGRWRTFYGDMQLPPTGRG